MKITPIHAIQGAGLVSPLSGQTVRTRGVVTGASRKGFFIQDQVSNSDPMKSDGLFVFSPRQRLPVGALVELVGRVDDFVKGDSDRPTTQLKLKEATLVASVGPGITPIWIEAETMPEEAAELARTLNGLEGMLVGVKAGAVFIAPSNPFGDYVVAPKVADLNADPARTAAGGVIIEHARPHRWFPGFRVTDYAKAPLVNIGATLMSPITGPLNYRRGAYQIAVEGPIEVSNSVVIPEKTTWLPDPKRLTILTLNGFNLDTQVESPERVKNKRLDIDDDVGDGRFKMLASAVVEQAGSPDIVALQEVQDNDGAELSDVVDATKTYQELVREVRALGGPDYHWADIPPATGEDGGQPGGNIRNAYLYNADRVTLVPDSLCRLGEQSPAYEGSRKPLLARFQVHATGNILALINVHLASKRHQNSIFCPIQAGVDSRLSMRVEQATIIRDVLLGLNAQGVDYYVTGDFNDFEFSETLRAMSGDQSVNLVERLAPGQRYDYNHRGKLQALMHGLVSKRQAQDRAEYQILHGNELIGVKPGELGSKPTDHAYVLARLLVASAGPAV